MIRDANRWTALAAIPTPRDHLAVAAVAGRLYAIGGRVNGNYARNLDANEAYNPQNDRWEQLSPLPTPRSGSLRRCSRVASLWSAARQRRALSIRSRHTIPRTDRWATHPRMPTPRHGLGAAVHAGRMYYPGTDAGRLVLGGERNFHALAPPVALAPSRLPEA